MDVVATRSCVVSLKISGRADELGQKYWQTFDEQFELVRHTIKEKYGIVQFASDGARIWWSLFAKVLFWLMVISGCAFIVSAFYRKKFLLLPSSTTRKYSVFIMLLSLIMAFVTILINELLRVSSGHYRYEYVPHFVLLFLVHLSAYLTNSPKVVAFALWLVVVSIGTAIGFWLLDWSALTTANWAGIIIGSALVIYTLVKTSSLKGKGLGLL